MKKGLIIGLLLAVLLVSGIAGCVTEEDIVSCTQDSDCIIVDSINICPIATSINSDYLSLWEEKREKYEKDLGGKKVVCEPARPKEDFIAKCVDNKCALELKEVVYVGEGESFLEEIGPYAPKDRDPITYRCKEGLEEVSSQEVLLSGECSGIKAPRYVCVDCGNEICGLGENKCNCPEDCK